MSNQLHISAVDVCYGEDRVVSGVSLALESGEIGCLLGPSGCGKTSLLRAIGGFEPVTAGAITLHGRLLSEPGRQVPPELRRIGMVFQDYALFPHLNIGDNVGYGLHQLGRAERQVRIDELLTLVGLEASAKAMPHELSGGQQQRVALARALAPQPELLLLDEPFSNLDQSLRESLAAEVRALLKAQQVTALMVTHDQHEAFALADNITLMREGRVVQQGTAYELYHQPAAPFAAEFIGQGNVLDLEITEQGELPLGLGPYSGSAPPGSRIRLLIRPDDVKHADDATLRLPITARSFRGAHYLYELSLPDGQRITSLTPSHVSLSVGELLPIHLDLRDLVELQQQI